MEIIGFPRIDIAVTLPIDVGENFSVVFIKNGHIRIAIQNGYSEKFLENWLDEIRVRVVLSYIAGCNCSDKNLENSLECHCVTAIS